LGIAIPTRQVSTIMGATGRLEVEFVGGGTVPGRIGWSSGSWGLLSFAADESGMSVYVRLKWLGWLFPSVPTSEGRCAAWTADWDDVEALEYTRNSFIVRLKSPRRGCRFSPVSKGHILELVKLFESKRVTVEQVRTTLRVRSL
jgi:hypothetical protein